MNPIPASQRTPAARPFLRLSAWEWWAGGILVGSLILRLFDLSMKVLHHDEGVNGLFMTTLFRAGYYHYDPSNYHGPTLYYFGWITTTINSLFFGKAGLSTDAIRMVTVLFGVGVVWLLLCLRRQLGDFGSLTAAALAAISPGFVFFSRYFIHEVLFVFFSLGIVVAWLRFRETAKPRYLMLASASAALLGATKETWVITIAVGAIAIPCTIIYSRLLNIPSEPTVPLPANTNNLNLYGTAALLFVTVWVLFYSSFFTNFPQGVYDSFLTFTYWFKTSSSAHRYGWQEYLQWLWKAEPATVVLGGLGLGLTFATARNRFAVFAAFWAVGILGAYSLVPYKTPWLSLNILLPFIVVAGYGLEQIHRWLRPAAWLLLVPGLAICLYMAIGVSFFRYDDDREPYVYAHTNRELLLMVDQINNVAEHDPAGNDIGVTVMSPEHWPLPWYLRDYKNAGYWGKVIDSREPILVVHETQVQEVEEKLGANYRLVRSYTLRPGNRLFLYVRKSPN
ncbi:MAG TPA: flippase activity-associated protein Agl23 [Candidatus Angelobacter sp.]|nr:flippase activity-associated protein Agl23 [Candidatus Angelobacter sp.]